MADQHYALRGQSMDLWPEKPLNDNFTKFAIWLKTYTIVAMQYMPYYYKSVVVSTQVPVIITNV